MLDMSCLVLAGPRERLSWRLSLAPAGNKYIWIGFIRSKLRARKRCVFMFEGSSLSRYIRWLFIFGIVLLVFGPKKLPELGKGIGGIHGFRQPCTR